MARGKSGTAKTQLSLRLPQELLDQVELRGGKNEVIELILQRYYEVILATKRAMRGKFTDGELSLIMEVCNGWLAESHINYLWAEVADGIGLNQLDIKWGVSESESLVERLRNLSLIELYAMHDAITLFWGDENGSLNEAFES